MSTLTQKEAFLCNHLRSLGSVMVAYSGGVDSSLLAYYARVELKERATIVIAISPSLAQDELSFAREQGKQFKWNMLEITTDEVEKSEYQENNEMRCYFCKFTLFEFMRKIALERNVSNLAYGANLDDRADFRPGHVAAQQFQVLAPLQDVSLSKEEIRSLAKKAGLPSWNRPQNACLSSRFPTFQPISEESLRQVDRAESLLHSLGLHQVRVRHHGQSANIEVGKDEVSAFLSNRQLKQLAEEGLKALGYTSVSIDPEGYRQGSSNISNKQESQIIELA